MAFQKGSQENILVESKTSEKHYRIEDLKLRKAALEAELSSIDNLIAEADKLGIKELPTE